MTLNDCFKLLCGCIRGDFIGITGKIYIFNYNEYVTQKSFYHSVPSGSIIPHYQLLCWTSWSTLTALIFDGVNFRVFLPKTSKIRSREIYTMGSTAEISTRKLSKLPQPQNIYFSIYQRKLVRLLYLFFNVGKPTNFLRQYFQKCPRVLNHLNHPQAQR